jgi:5-methylcytosine-specific restriction enzyme subunit McrC
MIIREYDYLQCKYQEAPNYLKIESFECIEKFVLENERAQYLKLTTKKGFGKVLQAQNFVGVIQTKDGTTIEILPKISNIENEEDSKNILLKMLKTLKKSPFKNLNTAHLQNSKTPLFEVFISMFLEELAKLIQKGIKNDYLSYEENLKFLKGKLKIAEQIKYNTIHKERFFVEYQEFSSDRVENRLIKTILEFLYKKSKSHNNQQRIREFLFVFDTIRTSHTITSDFAKIKLNRQMKAYEQVLLWSKTFLLENSFSPYKGNDLAFALLFDMNLLFESYVASYLKKQGLDVRAQDRGKHLVEEPKKFALRPDLVIHKQNQIIIADTKYKVIKEEKDISQSDMYQLFAYGKKYQNQKLFLIYPKNDVAELDLFYKYEDELELKVLFFDLALNLNDRDFLSTMSLEEGL